MSEPALMQTKALTAYFKSCHTSLSAVISMIGQNQKCIEGPTLSEDIVGRIARFRGTTPEKLHAAAAAFVTK